jgi:hypothetical protein
MCFARFKVANLVAIGVLMASKVMHLVNRNGRYHARLVVPKGLRRIIGKTELCTPLGADRREALKLLLGGVAQLQHKICYAERQIGQRQLHAARARYPLVPNQIAQSHYTHRLITSVALP